MERSSTARALVAVCTLGAALSFVGCLLASYVNANFAKTSWALGITLTAIALSGLVFIDQARGRTRGRARFDPLVLLAVYLGVLYVGRPLYVLTSGQVGTHQIGFWSDPGGAASIQWLVLAALIVLGVSVGVWPYRGAIPRFLHRFEPRAPASYWLLTVSAVVSLACFSSILPELARFPGGWRAALTLRQDLYAGRTFIVYGLGAMNIAWLVMLATRLPAVSRRDAAVLCAVWSVSSSLVLISGSRSEFVTRCVLPLTVLLLVSIKDPFKRLAVAVAGLVIASLVFAGYREFVRDPQSEPVAETAASSTLLRGPVGFLLSGDETSAFDYLAALRISVPQDFGYRGFETFEAVTLAPIPSGIVSDKPDRGGEYVTKNLRPSLYERGGNLAISGFGDLYLTAGPVSVLIGACLLGFLVAMCTGAYSRGVGGYPLLYVEVYLVACIVPVLRSDLTELAVGLVRVGLIVAVMLFARIIERERSSRESGVERHPSLV